jgi:RNA polymerase sigma factor (sigma-70 family)
LEDLPTFLVERFTLDSREARPDRIVERLEERAFLHDGMSQLTPCRRRVLEGYLHGLSTTEIAESLGMSEDAVRQHKSRGLRNLRQMNAFA